jgi:WD40 repeat protein
MVAMWDVATFLPLRIIQLWTLNSLQVTLLANGSLDSSQKSVQGHAAYGEGHLVPCITQSGGYFIIGHSSYVSFYSLHALNTPHNSTYQSLLSFQAHERNVTSVFYVATTGTLITTSEDATIRLWTLRHDTNHHLTSELAETLREHVGGIRCAVMVGSYLLTGSYDKVTSCVLLSGLPLTSHI